MKRGVAGVRLCDAVSGCNERWPCARHGTLRTKEQYPLVSLQTATMEMVPGEGPRCSRCKYRVCVCEAAALQEALPLGWHGPKRSEHGPDTRELWLHDSGAVVWVWNHDPKYCHWSKARTDPGTRVRSVAEAMEAAVPTQAAAKPEPRFKAGDRVRCVVGHELGVVRGAEYVVAKVYENLGELHVRVDGIACGFRLFRFELVQTEKPKREWRHDGNNYVCWESERKVAFVSSAAGESGLWLSWLVPEGTSRMWTHPTAEAAMARAEQLLDERERAQ